MNKLINWLAALSVSVLLLACAGENTSTENTDESASDTPAITLTPLEGSPAFAEAGLSLEGDPEMVDDSTYRFSFAVSGYTLGEQTTPATPNNLANSAKGQHIHFIVDNGPYSAHYEPEFTSDKFGAEGNHVVLAFLSRSYHESVKNMGEPTSYVIAQMGEGEKADLSAPHMFYSRPKGTYSGEDAQKVLLDFFLLNTDLAADGNKVRVTINGDSEFMIDTWQPYVIEGAPLGTLTVKLELLDAAGNLVPSPFNPVTREVNLEE